MLGSLEGNTESPSTTSSEHLLLSCSRQESWFPCVVWKGFPACTAPLRMRPASRGNSRQAPWLVPHVERPWFPGPPYHLDKVDEGWFWFLFLPHESFIDFPARLTSIRSRVEGVKLQLSYRSISLGYILTRQGQVLGFCSVAMILQRWFCNDGHV